MGLNWLFSCFGHYWIKCGNLRYLNVPCSEKLQSGHWNWVMYYRHFYGRVICILTEKTRILNCCDWWNKIKRIHSTKTCFMLFKLHTLKLRVLTGLILKDMQAFSDCLWREFLSLCTLTFWQKVDFLISKVR